MSDSHTTVHELRQLVEEFVACRDWHQFHTPKNLAMSIAIEAAELMEHFQWLTPEESTGLGEPSKERDAVGEELADVICYALAMANELDIDLTETVRAKMVKNEQKYPAAEFKGRYGPDDSGRNVGNM